MSSDFVPSLFLSSVFLVRAGLTEDTSQISATALRALGGRLCKVRHIGGFYHLMRDNEACKALCSFVYAKKKKKKSVRY